MTLAVDTPAHLTPAESSALLEHEAVIERGLQTFYEVGMALLAIRDGRLYRDGYPTFEAYCQERWQMTRQYANNMIAAASVIDNLETIVVKPTNEAQARPLTTLAPDEQRIVWDVVQQTAPAGKVTAAHVQSVANVFKEVVTTGAIDDGSGEQIRVADVVKAAITEETYERMMRQQAHIRERMNGTPKALQISDYNEWYTPAPYLETVRQLMGAIDLDPASNDMANRVVQASTYYTAVTNGFDKEWRGRVWLNPPYGRENGDSNQERWSGRLISQYARGITTEAVLLVNAVTDRKWFQPLWDYPICFVSERIRFYDEHGEFGQPTHGNVFVYFGKNPARFATLFQQYGRIVIPQGQFSEALTPHA